MVDRRTMEMDIMQREEKLQYPTHHDEPQEEEHRRDAIHGVVD
jgi:hypothetical protein